MAAGNVGKLSVTVYPDSRKFKEQLRKSLERIEKQVKARIEVIPVLDRSSLADVRKDLKERLKDVRTTVSADLSASSLKEVKRKLDDLEGEATVNADLDKGKAAAQLAWFDRPRVVEIRARVSTRSLAAAKAALMALSGGNVIKRLGSGLRSLGSNLDLVAAKAAMVGPAILNVASVSMVALGGIASLGNGLAATLPVLLAAPGVLGAFAAGGGVLVAALADVKDVLADLGPAFTDLQDSISVSFWKQAADPIRDLARAALPALQGQLNDVATQFGLMGQAVASAVSDHIPGFQGTLQHLSQAVGVAGDGVGAFVDGLLSLGEVGASFLPAIASKANEVALSFRAWADNGLADGSIAQSIQDAWNAVRTLGDLLVQVGGIVSAVFTAIGRSGHGALTPAVEALRQVNQALSAPGAQETLTTTFKAAREAVSRLGPGVSQLLGAFGALAPVLQQILPLAGQIGSVALGGIAQAAQALIASGGLQDFFLGVRSAVQALAPTMPALGQALGAVASVAGDLVAALGPVIAQLVSSLAPVIVELAGALSPIISMLGEALVPIIQALAPVIASVLAVLAPIIVQLVDALLPVIVQIVEIAASALVPLIEVLAPILQLITDAIVAILPALTPVLDLLAQLVAAVLPNVIAGFQMFQPVIEAAFSVMVAIIQAALGVIAGVITAVMGVINGDWSQVWEGIKQVFSSVWEGIKAVVQGAIKVVQSVISAGVDLVRSIWSDVWNSLRSVVSGAWSSIGSAVSAGVNAMMSFIRNIPSQVRGVFSGAGSWLTGAGRQIIDGLVNGIKGAFDKVKSTLSSLTSLLPDWKGPAPLDKVILRPAGRLIIGGLVDGMESQYSKVERSLGGLTNSIPSTIDLDARRTHPNVGASISNHFEIVNHDPQVAARWVAQEVRGLMGVS
ncbi:hypothetical protein [Actinomyces faecalis]|uniref:phage tail protein n=1 Tax=Actinomyces faecalis TaxID=2722820 RepID=UPI0015532771|nr:hypothetical protein [Actinomyces faecalis]